jgi:MFS family permease
VLAVTGLEVVLFQYWISRRIRRYPPFLMLASGAGLFAIGIVMYGLMTGFWMFALAAVIVCVGEMFYFPVSQAVAAGFAPADMRGRYMAVANLAWAIPATVGPAAAGYLLDHANPALVWFVGSGLCVAAGLAYLTMHAQLGKQPRFSAASEEAAAID